jgi:predicted ABC-type ATPase
MNLSVETNLRNEFLVESADTFKQAKYQTRLIFMLLPDIESSMDRVNLRVKKKGHFVDAQSIRYNFEKSLENLFLVANKFDQVMLVCAASGYEFKLQPELLLTVKNGMITKENKNAPAWAVPIVEKLTHIFIDNDKKLFGPKR